MDLSNQRGMPKVSGGKLPTTHARASAREVGGTPPTETSRSKWSSDALVQQTDDLAWRHKKVKILSRRHKSYRDEGGLDLIPRVKSRRRQLKSSRCPSSPSRRSRCWSSTNPKSMKDLCGTKVQKDDAGWSLFDRVHDAGRLITFMDYRITSLQQEIDALKSGGHLEAMATTEERATKLERELEKTKHERDEALQRLEISDKELNGARGDLSEAQRQLKEARVRARRDDDELLKSMKDLESTQVKILRWAIDDYKGSADFKEGLKRMGRVSYEYGYRIALARFRALHTDSEVEEDPFTI
ncbi:hypothetical protein BHM03_00050165 [Ensete ventricosum]|nr:hypothetical protein BHM03_00050165 [Ensete ventricosum]